MAMDPGTDLAFIGYGEAARAFVGTLRAAGARRVLAYDRLIHGDGAGALRRAAAAQGVDLCDDPAAVAAAPVVISAVTAAESFVAVRPLSGLLGPGQVLIDINSVSAARKRDTARLVRQGGAAYVDMAVMAPVHPAGHRTPVLLAGDLTPAVAAWIAACGFRSEVAGSEPGDATAVKMVRSLFVKGLEAITVQTLAAAAASGCLDRVAASLAASFPGLGWPAFAAYEFERVLTHGIRRAEELREVAATMRDLGFAAGGRLADGIADVQDGAARSGALPGADAAATARALADCLLADRPTFSDPVAGGPDHPPSNPRNS